MRYRDDHKEKTHAKIVEQASQEFRQHGFEGVGIASLMAKLGLSHGGFYAHFEDKDDLKDQAMVHAMEHSLQIALDALRRGGVRGYVEHYTSDLHKDHPGFGCILPTLTAEEARRPQKSRAKFAKKFQDNLEQIAEHLPGATPTEKKERALFMLSALSGSIAIARAAGDPELSESILRSVREQLIQFFGSL